MQWRLDEVSLAVILSVTQAGTQSGQIRAIVCEEEEHKSASNGARAKMHCVCFCTKGPDFNGRHPGLSLVPRLV